MTATEVLTKIKNVKKAGTGWVAQCPAHPDKHASLSIGEGREGCILLKCHAGCAVDAICAALNIKAADLFQSNGQSEPKRRVVARYVYRDESGAELFQCVRYEPKDFRQGHKDASGNWVPNLNGVRRVLYRLPELLKGLSRSLPVIIVEGEKDVETLAAKGYVATTSPMGAGKWRPEYSETLKGALVFILPDADKPGREHAEQVAASLHGKARRVAIVPIPQVENKLGIAVKDATDFFAAGGTIEQLQEAIDAAPEWRPAAEAAEAQTGDEGKPEWGELIEDATRIVAMELPPIAEIVEGLITAKSKSVIGSSAKSFKTWVSIDLGLSISHGAPFLGRKTAKAPVLYVNFELKRESFNRRLQIVAQAKGLRTSEGAFLHLPLRGRLSGLTVQQIVSRIIQLALYHKAAVVICDPIYKLNLVGDENSSRDQTILFNEIDRITTEAGCAVVLNDHFSKGNQSEKDPLDAIRGSSAKGGDVDCAIILRKHQVEDCYRVDVIHRELPPVESFCIGWRFPLMEERPDLDPEEMKKASGGRPKACDPRKYLAAIKDHDHRNPISISAWASLAGVSRSTLQNNLSSLRLKGWIATAGEGNEARQYITQKGLEEVANYV